jgi:hypothetical protein
MTAPKKAKGAKSLSQTAFKLYQKDWKKDLTVSFTFLLVAAMVLALGYLAAWSLFLTIPLILIPFLFAIQMSISSYKGGAPLSNRVFFHFFGLYFNPNEPFFGVYRVWLAFLKAFLTFWLLLFGIGLSFSGIGNATWPEFSEALKHFASLMDSGSAQEVVDYLNGSMPLLLFQKVVMLSSLLPASYFFVHSVSVCTLNPYVRMSLAGAPARVANSIFAGGFRSVRHSLYKEYYKALYLGVILLVIGLGAGVTLGSLLTLAPEQIYILALAGAALTLAFYLPYFFNVIELLATRYEKSFADYSIHLAEQTLSQMKQEHTVSPEEAKKYEQELADAKKGKAPKDDDDDSDSSD